MNFNEIIGNDNIKKELEDTLSNNLLGHSYIFQGTEGIGKVLFAKAFAEEILCENKNSCGSCKSCTMFNSDNHPDFMIVNLEETIIKIEDIRELIKKVIEKPIISTHKVYIINAADKMTKDAQNCLLKTLEEPPEYMTIILIASNENLLLSTIKSRCIKISFNKLLKEEIKKYIKLKKIEDLNEDFIDLCNGSIKRLEKIIVNKERYAEVKELLTKIEERNKLDFYMIGKDLFTKENIQDILEYSINVVYNLGLKNKRLLECISPVQNTISKINSNCNFDMCIDNMLFKIWEEVNENNSWS